MKTMHGVAGSLAVVVGLSASPTLFAGEGGDGVRHLDLPMPETAAAAWADLEEHNAKLRELLAKEKLDAADGDAAHLLSYPLENALEKLGAELVEIQDLLEEMHVASEEGRLDDVRESGRAYLEAFDAWAAKR